MYVKFSDSTQVAIETVFACPQNFEGMQNLGEVDEQDPRYLAFLEAFNSYAQADPEAAERVWRDAEIVRVAWLRDRHRDEVELGGETSITAEQYAELLAYLQALRDWPQSADFPDNRHRPLSPGWIAGQTE